MALSDDMDAEANKMSVFDPIPWGEVSDIEVVPGFTPKQKKAANKKAKAKAANSEGPHDNTGTTPQATTMAQPTIANRSQNDDVEESSEEKDQCHTNGTGDNPPLSQTRNNGTTGNPEWTTVNNKTKNGNHQTFQINEDYHTRNLRSTNDGYGHQRA